MILAKLRACAAVGLCLFVLAGCDDKSSGKAADKPAAAPELGVILSAEDAAHLGIRTAPVRAARFTPQIHGYGAVAGFEALAQAVSDVATAEAAARQSAATLRRNLSLAAAAAISREGLDAAQKQAATDAAALTLARRKEATSYGRNAPWLGRNRALLAKLARGELVLVHVTLPLAAVGTPEELIVERVGHLSNATGWTTKEIWNAPADAAIPGRGFFALIAGSNLAEGDRLLVSMPFGAPVAGVLIPADAMVLNGDRAWFYTAEGGDVFARHPLDVARPMDGGYFTTGLAAGKNVVVQGAGLLLSRELNPSSSGD
jgi:hypothetical protein